MKSEPLQDWLPKGNVTDESVSRDSSRIQPILVGIERSRIMTGAVVAKHETVVMARNPVLYTYFIYSAVFI
jgi:hypothetical protein